MNIFSIYKFVRNFLSNVVKGMEKLIINYNVYDVTYMFEEGLLCQQNNLSNV